MPSSRVLIASNTLTGTAASVTFSSIPATYTDLVLKVSIRSDRASAYDDIKIVLNNSTTAVYSETRLQGNGSVAASVTSSGNGAWEMQPSVGNNATSNTFSNNEYYFPNYLASANKPVGGFGTGENNATGSYIMATAHLWRNTSAINRIDLSSTNGANFVSGSTFWLYGLKNS